jgi:hypothetical protein
MLTSSLGRRCDSLSGPTTRRRGGTRGHPQRDLVALTGPEQRVPTAERGETQVDRLLNSGGERRVSDSTLPSS